MQRETTKPYYEQRRIVAYQDGLQSKVKALRELQSPPLHYGDAPQSASGDASQVAPVLWADVDIVPERSEWDVVNT